MVVKKGKNCAIALIGRMSFGEVINEVVWMKDFFS